MPQQLRKRRVSKEVNPWMASQASSSGIPKVTKELCKLSFRTLALPMVLSMMGQFEYLSSVMM